MSRIYANGTIICTLIFLLITTVLSNRFPDVSQNPNICFKTVQKSVHECNCEPYNENYMKGKPSYIKFNVSIVKNDFNFHLIEMCSFTGLWKACQQNDCLCNSNSFKT